MEESTRKKRRKRSPGYPLINLEEAIRKAGILWDKDKTNHIPKEVACEHMGYSTQAGYAGRILAALKQFNLITEKSGDIVLTQDAVDLALIGETDSGYIEVVKKFALKPAIYARLYNDNNGDIPSDGNLKVKLVKSYDFNPGKVERFIKTFRETLKFAELTEKEVILAKEEKQQKDKVESRDMGTESKESFRVIDKTEILDASSATIVNRIKSYRIPLLSGQDAILTFESFPVTKGDLDVIKSWIDLMEERVTKEQLTKEETSRDLSSES